MVNTLVRTIWKVELKKDIVVEVAEWAARRINRIMTWGYFYCPHCGENKKSNSDLWKYDGDTTTKICKKNGCQEIQQEIDEAEAKLNKNQAEIDRLNELKRKTKEDGKKQLREAELKYAPHVLEDEEKTGKKCWAHSDSTIPITGTCEKCKSNNQVIFEPTYKIVSSLDEWGEPKNPFINNRCADCYCQEEGIKLKKTPSNQNQEENRNDDRSKYTSLIHDYPTNRNTSEDNCPVCQNTLSSDEKLLNYFTEEPKYKFCGTCWPQAQEHQKILKRIDENKEINVESEIINNSALSARSRLSLSVLARVKKGENVNIDAISTLSEQEKQDLREIAEEVKNKKRSPQIDNYQDKNSSGLPDPVKGLIVISVIILIVVVIRKCRKRKKNY